MTESSAIPSEASDEMLLRAPFVQQLVRQLRAQDAHGVWDGKTDLQLLKPYIHTPEERRAIPIMGDPDPETLWRLELFYSAIAVAIERETGQMVSPMMKMSHEASAAWFCSRGGSLSSTSSCATYTGSASLRWRSSARLAQSYSAKRSS